MQGMRESDLLGAWTLCQLSNRMAGGLINGAYRIGRSSRWLACGVFSLIEWGLREMGRRAGGSLHCQVAA
jgi:hypothetical protein